MKGNKYTLKQILHYKFDNMMSRGAIALIGWLGLISLSIVFLASMILISSGITPDGSNGPLPFIEGVWISLMRTLAAGNLGRDTGWNFRIIMFFVTLGGIFIVSTLIGILNNGIRKKLESLKKARSFVVEENHTLILGWSSKVFSIVEELAIANENEKGFKIVILANKDKEKMEDEIKAKLFNLKRIKLVFRTGNPLDFDDLNMVNPQASKSIIVIAPEDESSDIHVIKTVLAITNAKNRRPEPYHIVAEIKDKKNMDAATIIGNNEVTFILTRDISSKLIVQTSQQPGLSIVYSELLSFRGSEIYFKSEPALAKMKFKDILFKYNKNCIIGICHSNGEIKLNPPMDTLLLENDQLILIAEDESKMNLSNIKKYDINFSIIKPPKRSDLHPDKILLLGWNQDSISVINEIENYVISGTETTVVAIHPKVEEDILSISKKLKNQKIHYIKGDITKRDLLESLNIQKFDHCIVLSYFDDFNIQKSDAITLITLLHLRDMVNKLGFKFNIVSQMMDIQNKKLAEVTRVDDFIVSEHLISLFLSQLSQNQKLKSLYDDIFNAEGSEIYLKSIEKYIHSGSKVNFYTLLESACQSNEIAIGYRKMEFSNNEDHNYGVVLNPDKTGMIDFKEGDKLIVVAEEE